MKELPPSVFHLVLTVGAVLLLSGAALLSAPAGTLDGPAQGLALSGGVGGEPMAEREMPRPLAQGARPTQGVPQAPPPPWEDTPSSSLLSPRQQQAAKMSLFEGHWLGLEVISLIPQLARMYRVPPGEAGVLVDEVTLESAESGIRAGDVIQSIGGQPTPDLEAFLRATQRVRNQGQTEVGLSRRGKRMTFVLAAQRTAQLGFAQMEAASPIMPGAVSPHRKQRGKTCTDCHVIMQAGGQLPTDAGDILPQPSPITGGARMPHGPRGKCSACHVVRGNSQASSASGPR